MSLLVATQYDLLRRSQDLADSIGFIGLFRNNVDPFSGFNAGLLTPANYAGYTPIPIGGTFETDGTLQNGCITWVAPRVSFAKSAGAGNEAIYGCFYLDLVGVQILLAQRFIGGPYPMMTSADVIIVRPQVAVGSPAPLPLP